LATTVANLEIVDIRRDVRSAKVARATCRVGSQRAKFEELRKFGGE
jgi:hypothetical protein